MKAKQAAKMDINIPPSILKNPKNMPQKRSKAFRVTDPDEKHEMGIGTSAETAPP